MTHLTPKDDLSIAQIAFFAPAFCISVFIFIRNGLFRQIGWFYLVTLSILRIVGASCALYASTQHDNSTGLLEAAAITSAVGTAPLLLTLLGMLERVNGNMQGKGVSFFVFLAIHLVSIGALVLAIVGGVKEPRTYAALKADSSVGQHLMEAAAVLFLAIFLALAFIVIFNFTQKRYIVQVEQRLVYAGLLALPFLLVRMIFTILVSFAATKNFYYIDVNVYILAFMQFLMEVIVVCLFITAGLTVPRRPDKPNKQEPVVKILNGPTRDHQQA